MSTKIEKFDVFPSNKGQRLITAVTGEVGSGTQVTSLATNWRMGRWQSNLHIGEMRSRLWKWGDS